MKGELSTEESLQAEVEMLRARVARLEQAEDAPQFDAIVMMSSAIAHDINNLMESVLGSAALVRGELDQGHPGAAMLETIERAAEQAGQLTKGLMSLTHGTKQEPQAINLNPIVCQVLLLEEQQLAPRIRIIRHVDPDLWDVAADYAQMVQLILHLAVNGIESIREEGRLILTTRNHDLHTDFMPDNASLRPGPYVYLCVEDSGCGMSPEELTQIYESTFSTKSAHRGLGLATVRAIIDRHGGFIEVNSTPDSGTAFHVYLPALKKEVEEAVDESAPKPKIARDTELTRGHNETVLIVDDDESISEVTQKTLERMGYQTLVAFNGKQAVEIAHSHQGEIHITLLDLAMPIMGGAEAFPLLRAARPDMKVIVCTGFERGPASKALLDAGVSAFLLKPFRVAVLLEEIRKVLDEN